MTESAKPAVHPAIANLTGGASPTLLARAFRDWAMRLATSPSKQMELLAKGAGNAVRLGNYAWHCAAEDESAEPNSAEPPAKDQRFAAETWQKWPFNLAAQTFLLQQDWWHAATTGVHGVSRKHQDTVEFMTRQWLDMIAPPNLVLTNPDLFWRTMQAGGFNLLHGFKSLAEDWQRILDGGKPAGTEKFIPGQNVAVTPGRVVHRNELMELIQYEPSASAVRREPVLFVPPWVKKYYVLDLSPQNSLVKYLTDQGFTVFMISWKNPGPEDRDLGLEHYRTLGVGEALAAIRAIAPFQKVHAAGYCLGGTLLSIAAAAMARDGEDRLATLTLLATQTDFSDTGEATLFLDEGEAASIEDLMRTQGFLDERAASAAFQMLWSKDLAWSRIIGEYLRGERPPVTDLTAWNADAPRVPYRLHSECLRELFLGNDLAEDRFVAGNEPVALSDIRLPVFAMGAEHDHIVPWQSTYRISGQIEGPVTYVRSGAGHGTSIVEQPGCADCGYRIGHINHAEPDPERFLAGSQQRQGSWWPEWAAWLANYSGPADIWQAMGAPQSGYPARDAAPGTYVLGPGTIGQ
jgi:polyhydroxyalkanoate synthase subunit PhaC